VAGLWRDFAFFLRDTSNRATKERRSVASRCLEGPTHLGIAVARRKSRLFSVVGPRRTHAIPLPTPSAGLIQAKLVTGALIVDVGKTAGRDLRRRRLPLFVSPFGFRVTALISMRLAALRGLLFFP
jgi:hypothetical protein